MEKEKAVSHQKRYYHQACLQLKQSETQHRKELIEYILILYKLQAPNGYIVKQIKTFKEDYKYTYKGIEMTLRYFHEVLGNPVLEDVGIGIVTHVYNKAKKYYIMKAKIEKDVEGFVFNHGERQISISPSPVRIKKQNVEINLDSL
jgi:hypothetical protein